LVKLDRELSHSGGSKLVGAQRSTLVSTKMNVAK